MSSRSKHRGSKFEVVYRPETVVIDPATTRRSFEGVSADGALLVFNVTAPAIRSLHAGNVLLLQGLSHGVIEQFKYVAKNLRGDVTIDFVATKKGDGALKGLEVKLPTPFQAPLPIGGLPFVLSIGEAVIVKPALSARNEVAEGHFKINCGGGQGFSVSGPGMAAEREPDGENEITSSSSLGIAPFAYIVALAMPRIELTLGMEKASGFALLEKTIPPGIADRAAELLRATTIGSQIAGVIKKTLKSEAAAHVEMVMVASHLDSGPLALLPCRKTTFDVHANAGYDVSALGYFWTDVDARAWP